jgi:adenosylcobinamide-GDP ribazoletransferase
VGFFTALRFLTILPLPLGRETRAEGVGRSLVYFPVIGLLLGLLLAGLDWGLDSVLPISVASGVLLVVLVLITGATHLDGFIDTCDGLVAGKTPQQRWEIMRDSRVGAFGVVGACCLLLLMYASLAGLPDSSRMGALVLLPVLGRWSVVCSIFVFPYARPEGLGRAFKDQATWLTVAGATVVALAVSVGFLRFTGLAIMGGVGLVTLALCVLLKRKFAGLTGDSYGAIIEVGEVTSLILVIALPSWSW